MGLTPVRIETFTFIPGLLLRATLLDGEPWFVARDVLDALHIKDTSSSVLAGIDSADKQRFSLGLRGQAPWLVNESGLYEMIFHSNKQEAVAFQKWLTKEVLPAIRKDGGYVTEATAQAMIEDPEVMLSKALLFATNRLKVAEDTVVVLTAENLKLEVRGKGLEEDAVPEMTVKQFIRSRKIAATTGQRISLGHKATVLGEVAGRPKVKVASEFVGNDGERRQGVAGFYPIKALERAATAMGLKENSHA